MSVPPAVVLAAGRGRRLGSATEILPKCLVPLADTTPLELLLDGLADLAVPELWIVSGYAREGLRRLFETREDPFPVLEIVNPDWETTNNIVSAAFVESRVRGAFVLINSDVVCDRRILAQAFGGDDRNALFVDPRTARRPEAMKTESSAGRLVAIGKDLPPERSAGEYIGVARFDTSGAATFFEAVRERIGRGETDDWYEAAIGDAASQIEMRLEEIGDRPWIEIDDAGDLERARREVLPAVRKSHVAPTRIP